MSPLVANCLVQFVYLSCLKIFTALSLSGLQAVKSQCEIFYSRESLSDDFTHTHI